MDINSIKGILAFGGRGGYFYSPYAEGGISLEGGDLNRVLEAPGDEDFSLGRMMRDYQHDFLEFEKGGKISKSDLDFICSMFGTEIEQEGELIKGNILLRPFEIKLNLTTVNLMRGTVLPVEKVYETENVRAGIWGLGHKVGVRYNLVLKN